MSQSQLKASFDAAFAEGKELALKQTPIYSEVRNRLIESNDRFRSVLSAALSDNKAFAVVPAEVSIGTSVSFNNKVVLTVFPAKHGDTEYVVGVDDRLLAENAGMATDSILQKDLPGAVKLVGWYLGIISTGAQVSPDWPDEAVERK
ncbi:MAG: hypothetical protein E5X53_14600 [Mesorhizobium sp.]|uniref:hypothetical protein n=1 Tax=Mesorhizobium sp. TaxID=1871066 RepID=UPI000FE63A93|nr:hypothetical protein [Mesorhizobium sp.]RWM20199.1 MAG: hypothetical protein EOR73_16150 [Mesorhizobium sp.]TIP73921.1 MAG: hypothetical protein E5X55_11950 [Mesorhizobium sp.]TIQ12461.1 MAG: hypothetical protein E5X57_13930 [Mesorhizobium sp.]TIR51673.1 MAG: hypothetical protein E5X53_14600 [Mesorhizobium sp.]TJV97444.1 MAG: hypothetical protein E5X52_13570 [Mesorhizobium sp.]